MEKGNITNLDCQKDDHFNSLIEEAVEGLRDGSLNIDLIIEKYEGDNQDYFLEELTNALALEEIFREFSGRPRPVKDEKKILEIEACVKEQLLNELPELR